MSIVKNVKIGEILDLKEEVGYLPGQISSKILVQDKQKSITLFSFDKDQEIATHTTKGDAILQVLEGNGKVVISNKEFLLQAGETIVMPSNVEHSVYAIEKFKMLLSVVYKYE